MLSRDGSSPSKQSWRYGVGSKSCYIYMLVERLGKEEEDYWCSGTVMFFAAAVERHSRNSCDMKVKSMT